MTESTVRLPNFHETAAQVRESWHCPGLAVAIVQGDNLLHQSVHGLRDVEKQQPVTDDTRFAIGSVTKSFAAASIALLIDEGYLMWDTPVHRYMPQFILADSYITRHLTVRDMLCHRTGLPRHEFSAWRLDISRADFLKRMRHLEFSTSFRQKFQYNNLMYYMIAHLVEHLSGQRWEDFVQERILAPLDMQETNFSPEPAQPGQHTATGYRIERDENGQPAGQIALSYGRHTPLSPGSAGAMFSTLADLIRWMQVQLNQGHFEDQQIISPDTLRQMHQAQIIVPGGGGMEALHGDITLMYGLGWAIQPFKGYKLVSHSGGTEGFTVNMAFIPQEQTGVIVLTNASELPVHEILTYTALEQALDLSSRDWNDAYHNLFDPILAGQARGKQTNEEERTSEAPPTHPLDTYAGTFSADGYPDFAVRLQDDTLQASTTGSIDEAPLHHYHYNIFEWHLREFDTRFKVTFQVNARGEVDALSIPFEPAVKPIVFKRKPLDLPDNLVDALTGTYDTDIEGVSFRISRKNDAVYLTQEGGSPVEIKPVKLDDSQVTFRIQRTRFEFVRDDDGINTMVIKTSEMNLEARRRTD